MADNNKYKKDKEDVRNDNSRLMSLTGKRGLSGLISRIYNPQIQGPLFIYGAVNGAAVLLLIVNAIALLFLFLAIHRLIGINDEDLNATLQIIVGIICVLPLWKIAEYLVLSRVKFKIKRKYLYRFSLCVNALFIVGVAGLWSSLDNFSECKVLKGDLAYEQRLYATARDLYIKALYLGGEKSQIYFKLANLYEEITEYDEAVENYWAAIYSLDDPFPAYNNLARVFLRREKYFEALNLLKLATDSANKIDIELSQNKIEQLAIIEKNKAWVYALLGDHEYANEAIEASRVLLIQTAKIQDYPFLNCLQSVVAEQQSDSVTSSIAGNLCRANLEEYSALEQKFVWEHLRGRSNEG